jgi:predicted HicB family RNase H-like nuclease
MKPEPRNAESARVVMFTLRLPEPLRDRLQKAAADQSVSINSYLVQCAQRCLRTVGT